MNKEQSISEIIEAEMQEYSDGAYADHGGARDQLQRFAAAIIAATKEEDAKICEQSDTDGEGPDCWDWHSKDYAKAIRESKP